MACSVLRIKNGYCRSGFPPHVNHEWSVVRDDWDDLVDDFFRRILIETLKYCKRKRSKILWHVKNSTASSPYSVDLQNKRLIETITIWIVR